MGWDCYHEVTIERQKRLGTVPGNVKLTPRPAGLPAADMPAGGAEGMIFSQGGFAGGSGFYTRQSRLVGLYSHVALERYRVVSAEPVPTGNVTLAMGSTYDGGVAKGGTLTLLAQAGRSAKVTSRRRHPSNTRPSRGRTSAMTPAPPSISATCRRARSPARLAG